MRKNKWNYKRPPACKRNEPSLTETAVIRLKELNKWSNVDFDELLRLCGIDIHNPELPFIDQLGYDTIVKLKNKETEHLENFGMKLFQNKLPDWRPPLYTDKHGRRSSAKPALRLNLSSRKNHF